MRFLLFFTELPWSSFFAVPRVSAHEDSQTLERVLEMAPLSSSDNVALGDEAQTPPNLIPHISYSNKNTTSNHTTSNNTSAHTDSPDNNNHTPVADLEAHIQGTSDEETTLCHSVVPTPLSEFPNQTHVDQVEL